MIIIIIISKNRVELSRKIDKPSACGGLLGMTGIDQDEGCAKLSLQAFWEERLLELEFIME